jgi:hypothetical protein
LTFWVLTNGAGEKEQVFFPAGATIGGPGFRFNAPVYAANIGLQLPDIMRPGVYQVSMRAIYICKHVGQLRIFTRDTAPSPVVVD